MVNTANMQVKDQSTHLMSKAGGLGLNVASWKIQYLDLSVIVPLPVDLEAPLPVDLEAQGVFVYLYVFWCTLLYLPIT